MFPALILQQYIIKQHQDLNSLLKMKKNHSSLSESHPQLNCEHLMNLTQNAYFHTSIKMHVIVHSPYCRWYMKEIHRTLRFYPPLPFYILLLYNICI